MSVNYRKMKDEWKQQGHIPEWYSSNALQFFMETYSYEEEDVKTRDETTNKWLAKFAPEVYPDYWNEDEYFKGLTWEQAFNKLDWDGFTIKRIYRGATYEVTVKNPSHVCKGVKTMTLDGKAVEGNDGIYASAVYDKSEDAYIVKVANTTDDAKELNIVFNGLKAFHSGKVTTLHAESNEAVNTVDKKNIVIPQVFDVKTEGNILNVNIGARTFCVYKFIK